MYIFEDREVTNPMTYIMVQNDDGTVTLTPAPGTVSKEGTPINKATMEALQRDIYNTLYPIGHVMIKADATDYSKWLDFTWERTAEGDAIVGYKANDSQAGQIGVEFGSNSVTVSHSGSTGATTLTIDQIPSHNHGVNDPGHTHAKGGYTYTTDHGTSPSLCGSGTPGYNMVMDSAKTGISIQNKGGGKSHTHTMNHSHAVNVVQKSMAFAVWKRVA